MVFPREISIRVENGGILVEAKTAASLRTFFVLVIFVETLESLVAFSGYSRAPDAKISTKIPLFRAGIREQ